VFTRFHLKRDFAVELQFFDLHRSGSPIPAISHVLDLKLKHLNVAGSIRHFNNTNQNLTRCTGVENPGEGYLGFWANYFEEVRGVSENLVGVPFFLFYCISMNKFFKSYSPSPSPLCASTYEIT
jgi:hypothetical protein